jgi:nitrite reductase (NADH) large subunit
MRYAIVGGSAAAISAVEAIRSVDKLSSIDLFSDEMTPLYSKVLLAHYVAKKLPKPLLGFRSPDFFEQNNVTAHLGIRVQEISADSKSLVTDKGETYGFDKLLLATGGRAIIPKIPGVDKKGISTLQTMKDAETVYDFKGKKVVVIGAGAIGIESCIGMMKQGIKATLVEALGRVLPTVFDDEASAIIRSVIEQMGIEVITGERAMEFTGNGHVQCVVTSAGEIECDNVILSVGVKPAVELAQKAGIEIGSMGGIKTDDYMMTSARGVYAAGDVCETFDIARNTTSIVGIWPTAVEQGQIAGLNMTGQDVRYPGSLRVNSTGNFIGIPAVSMGVTHTDECSYVDESCHFQEIKESGKNTYKKMILNNGCIVGAIFVGVGQTRRTGLMSALMRKQIDVSDHVAALMSNSLNFLEILPLLERHGDKFTEPEYKNLVAGL